MADSNTQSTFRRLIGTMRAEPDADDNEWEAVYVSVPLAHIPWESHRPSAALQLHVAQGTIQGRVLDVGCGLGTHAIWMASQGLDVSGIDISPTSIQHGERRAEEQGVEVDFQVADALALPFHDQTFDAIFDRGTYHHFDERKTQYVEELQRVLKPGGRILLLAFSPRMKWSKSVTAEELRQTFGRTFTLDWLGEEIHTQPDGREVILLTALLSKRHG